MTGRALRRAALAAAAVAVLIGALAALLALGFALHALLGAGPVIPPAGQRQHAGEAR